MRALACTLSALLLAACGKEAVTNAAPRIDVQPLALDFGPIPVGLQVSIPVLVQNQGRADLVIQPATVDGSSDYRANAEPLTIGAGDRVQIELFFQPSAEGVRDATVHLVNNSENDTDVALAVTGQGTPRLVCAECNTPPSNYCATTVTLITYEPHGTCVSGKCEYQASTTICGGNCIAATRTCSTPLTDAGVVDAGVRDAGVMDAGVADAGTDAGFDAGVVDAGVGLTVTTPGVLTWTVPTGVTSVTVDAWGGGGAGGEQVGATGGGAAFGRATFAVTPGETLEVRVAEGGRALGSGGGASSVWRGTTALLVIAGGGGGGSDGNSGLTLNANGRGGAGGVSAGQDGFNFTGMIAPYCTGATGGRGASATAGGLGGAPTGTATTKCSGQPGAALAGGRATGVNGMCDMGVGADDWHQGGGQGNGGGGGGGAGWFGGGGAGFIWTYCSGGGGGGSSYVASSATNPLLVAGVDRVQGNAAQSQGAGAGGFDGVGGRATGYANSDGKNGRVVLTW